MIGILEIFLGCSGADPGFDQGGAPDRDRPKTAILGPQFCRILVLGPHFWWSGGGPGPPGPPPPGSAPGVSSKYKLFLVEQQFGSDLSGVDLCLM